MPAKNDLTTKIIFFILGIFLTTTAIAILSQTLKTTGLWLAIPLIAGAIFYGFYYCEAKSYRRMITWGVIATVILITVLFMIIINSIETSLG